MGKFLKSVLSYSMSFFGFWSRKIDVKTLELKDKIDNDINIAILRKDYEQQVNIALDDQYNKFTKITSECNLLSKKIDSDKDRLETIATEIIRSEDEANTVNIDQMDTMEKMTYEYSLKNMKLEAKTLLADIQFNERFLGDQKQTMELMAKQYHENRYRAKQVLRELQSLEHRNALVESRSSIEQLELGVSNYKISDIIKIVEGKESAIEAKNFADSVLLREGKNSVVDERIEHSNNLKLEADLNNYLSEVKSKTLQLN